MPRVLENPTETELGYNLTRIFLVECMTYLLPVCFLWPKETAVKRLTVVSCVGWETKRSTVVVFCKPDCCRLKVRAMAV